MPISFLKRSRRRSATERPRRPLLPPDRLETRDQSLRLQYRAKSSDGIRIAAREQGALDLPSLLEGIALSPVELIEPLDVELQAAAPLISRPEEALLWITAYREHSPIARHGLQTLELLDAMDPAYETIAVALLDGETDATGIPRYDAIVGGLISYWDETGGDLIVRAATAWGGEGARADTERMAQRLLARMVANLMASQGVLEIDTAERRVAVGGEAVCGHCGFEALDRRAHYCPKCGMRAAPV